MGILARGAFACSLLLWTTLAYPKAPPVKLTIAQARKIALDKVPGELVHDELEREKGRWIYSIEIRPTGETRKRITEVNVDAVSGAVVEVSIERE
jgi:uncharacterized membrane protein YkoI